MPRTKGWKAKIQTDKTTTKLDLAKISPELAEIEWVDTDADKTNQRHCPLCFEIEEGFGHADDCQYPTIAATMLRLAEENERIRQGINKIADCFVGCYECKKKVKREIKILEDFLAARQGDETKKVKIKKGKLQYPHDDLRFKVHDRPDLSGKPERRRG